MDELDESLPIDAYNHDQEAYYTMLEDPGRRSQLARIHSCIPHLPKPLQHSVKLVMDGMSWHDASQVIYGTKTRAGGTRLQNRLRVHMDRIERIRKALQFRSQGATLAHCSKILLLDRNSKNCKSIVHKYLKVWRKVYGL